MARMQQRALIWIAPRLKFLLCVRFRILFYLFFQFFQAMDLGALLEDMRAAADFLDRPAEGGEAAQEREEATAAAETLLGGRYVASC